MRTYGYRVAIVVDPAFGEHLVALADRMHVWVADTPSNRDVAERIWATTRPPTETRGVTTFRVEAGESPDQWAAHILPEVDLHHGEFSHDPPVAALEIHGAALSVQLQSALQALGFAIVDAQDSLIVASLALRYNER